MDEEARWRRHYAAITRAHEVLEQAEATLDQCAIDDATRPFNQPDALLAWAAGMPKPVEQEPARMPQERRRMTAAEIDAMRQVMLLKRKVAKLEHANREAARYRTNLEMAIGKVMAELQRADAGQQTEIKLLREQVRREPIDLPPLKLVGNRNG